MKLPKKEKAIQTIELCGVDWYKDVEKYYCYKDERFFDNKAQVTIKVKGTKEYRKAVRDIKALVRVFNRLKRHGWKEKGKEGEAEQ